MDIQTVTDALTRIPPFTLVFVAMIAAFALAAYALYVVDRGRR